MSKTLMTTLATLLAALIAAAPLAAQTCSNSIDPTAPLQRYTLHDDGTVTDRRSGLRWQRCPIGYTFDDGGTPLNHADDGCDETVTSTVDWQGALQAAESLNNGGGFAGLNNWRLPNIKELMSLAERQCASPAINLSVFPDTPSGAMFWSSTTYIHIDTALVLDVAESQNTTAFKQSGANHVRLVSD